MEKKTPPPGFDSAYKILNRHPTVDVTVNDPLVKDVLDGLSHALTERREAWEQMKAARERWQEAETVFRSLLDALDEVSAPGARRC